MEQAKSQRIVSSIQIHRKPFSDFTNRHRITSFSQSKKPSPSVVPGSTVSTQNPMTPTPDDWVRVGNRIARTQRNTLLKTRNKTKATANVVPVYPSYLEKTQNEMNKSKHIMERDVCSPFSGSAIHDNGKLVVDGEVNVLQSMSSTDPPPINKRRKCSSAESFGKYVVPQDFIDQQRAFYEEIDGYELQVEDEE